MQFVLSKYLPTCLDNYFLSFFLWQEQNQTTIFRDLL